VIGHLLFGVASLRWIRVVASQAENPSRASRFVKRVVRVRDLRTDASPQSALARQRLGDRAAWITPRTYSGEQSRPKDHLSLPRYVEHCTGCSPLRPQLLSTALRQMGGVLKTVADLL
jgi:hypothetical protein